MGHICNSADVRYFDTCIILRTFLHAVRLRDGWRPMRKRNGAIAALLTLIVITGCARRADIQGKSDGLTTRTGERITTTGPAVDLAKLSDLELIKATYELSGAAEQDRLRDAAAAQPFAAMRDLDFHDRLSSVGSVMPSPASREETTRMLDAVIAELKGRVQNIVGDDDRTIAPPAPTAQQLRDQLDSVVALFEEKVGGADKVKDEVQTGETTLATQALGEARASLCRRERFYGEQTGAFGSGVLVGDRLVATAAHNFFGPKGRDIGNVRFVFGFRQRAGGMLPNRVKTLDTYKGRVSKFDIAEDWALVELERDVPAAGQRFFHHRARVRRTGKPVVGDGVQLAGHPLGLLLTYAPNAKVSTVSDNAFFYATVDSFEGNSGSPVFGSSSNQVEGILLGGRDQHFYWDRESPGARACELSQRQLESTNGQRCAYTSLFAQFVP